MYQGINTVDRLLEGARQVEEAAVGATPLVEIYHEGEHLGTADPKLARAVVMAIRLKRTINQAQEVLDNYLEEIKARVREAGLAPRPLTLKASGEGQVTVSRKEPSVKVADARGLYAIFGEAVFDLLSLKVKKELKAIALSGDHPKAEEVRKCLTVEVYDEDTVRVDTRIRKKG